MNTPMLFSLVLGASVGLVMGLTGAGGGILAVPLLVFALNMTVSEAGPIALLSVGLSAAVGAMIGFRAGAVRYRAAMVIAGTGILAAPLGVWLAQRLDTNFLGILFAVVLIWIAYKNLMEGRQKIQKTIDGDSLPCIRDEKSGRFVWTSKCASRLLFAGSFAGVLSGLLGVGGGFVMVPALQRYTDLAMKSVVATSLAIIALISLTGVVVSVSAGHFDHDVGVPFAGGSAVGMLIGQALSLRLPAKYLKIAFAIICILVACLMVGKTISS
ncbi:sulfite exporter TauE/SafE family protein [Herminiimonas fonticola]|uniref:Probable membrane transporter protein n=1 Tax=Herminiimonas fonticola TaxID=303380 RepID=A0A4R6G5M1_9BURK|nr:putative permease [Herminiimonas fonticola]TDN89747.1 hypothetical protein EV677_1808 [Herminiimonas fonticola]